MLDTVSIDRSYFEQTVDEIIKNMMINSNTPIEITLLMSITTMEFASQIKEALFGKEEDK